MRGAAPGANGAISVVSTELPLPAPGERKRSLEREPSRSLEAGSRPRATGQAAAVCVGEQRVSRAPRPRSFPGRDEQGRLVWQLQEGLVEPQRGRHEALVHFRPSRACRRETSARTGSRGTLARSADRRTPRNLGTRAGGPPGPAGPASGWSVKNRNGTVAAHSWPMKSNGVAARGQQQRRDGAVGRPRLPDG